MIARITDGRRIGVIAALLLGAVGCGVHSPTNLTTGVPGYQSDTQSIEMISAVVGAATDKDVHAARAGRALGRLGVFLFVKHGTAAIG